MSGVRRWRAGRVEGEGVMGKGAGGRSDMGSGAYRNGVGFLIRVGDCWTDVAEIPQELINF